MLYMLVDLDYYWVIASVTLWSFNSFTHRVYSLFIFRTVCVN